MPAGAILTITVFLASCQVAEHLFCTYFFVEITIRFLAFATQLKKIRLCKKTLFVHGEKPCAKEYKCDCFRDFWFVFDFCLSLYMVAETTPGPTQYFSSKALEGPSSCCGFSSLLLLVCCRHKGGSCPSSWLSPTCGKPLLGRI